MRVTIKEIADKSGVSVGTASRILSDKGDAHTPDTRERVLAVAALLGYRANSFARAVRQGRFQTVALVLSQTDGVRSLLPPDMLDGIHDALAQQGQKLLVTRLPDESLTDPHFVPAILKEASADGLLINYNAQIPERLITLVRQHQIPAIWLNSRQDADCVYPDDAGGMFAAVQALYAAGHRRIAYLDNVCAGHYSAEDRLEGYRRAMIELGLPTIIEVSWQARNQSMRLEMTRDWLKEARKMTRPTAVIVYSNQIAMLVVHAAHGQGIAIPEDLSLICVNDRVPDDLGIEIAAMELPEYRIGVEAVRMLLEKIENPARTFAPQPVPLVLQSGATIVPPKFDG